MSHLYDQFSDNIFYANTLSGADPADVKALYVAYHAECVDLSAYTGLNYLSYAFSVKHRCWHEPTYPQTPE